MKFDTTQRYTFTMPTSDPRYQVQVIRDIQGKKRYIGVVINATQPISDPVGARAMWIKAGRLACHLRGLKLKGKIGHLRWWKDMSESERLGIEQDIITWESGLDHPTFDADDELN